MSDINIELLSDFVPTSQLRATRNFIGEHKKIGERLTRIIENMPATYGQENVKSQDKIVYLHYFKGGSDWYIVEKDSEPEQEQAYGYVILNDDEQMGEWGYISIVELLEVQVELDFFFEPKKFREVMAERNGETNKPEINVNDIYYTTAPEAYDYTGTKTLELTGYTTDRGKEYRKVFVPENNKSTQLPRYSSGNHGAFSQADFDSFVNYGSVKKKQDESIAQAVSEIHDIFSGKKIEVATVPSTETHTETEIVENIIQTEQNKAPLEKIELQNPVLQDLSYIPMSDSCTSVDTIVPASMRYDMHRAIENIDRRVNGVDEYVAEKLGYVIGNCSIEQRTEGLKCLCDAFSAEQVDAIATAIYNIEERGQGCIIGDQTGIGKGRIAAGMIRYAINRGLKPIFITEKPRLFSDIYRDIIAIGSDDAIPFEYLERYREVEKRIAVVEDEGETDEDNDTDEEEDMFEIVKVPVYKRNKKYDSEIVGKKRVVPFIVNGAEKDTAIKDEQGNIIYKGLTPPKIKNYIATGTTPNDCNLIITTYSQFNRVGSVKSAFLQKVASGNIVIMDESHNASGESNIGMFLQEVLKETKGVTFLSATFAKRPDNMPIYASKTVLSEANLDSESLIRAITSGGVALQEIVSSNLVAEGQMIRRERSFEGIEVNYKYLDASQEKVGLPNFNLELRHRAIMDEATSIIRAIMDFQEDYVNPIIDKMDKLAVKEYSSVEKRKGTAKAGVDNPPVFSGIFNIINQLLFSIKAEAVAEVAIRRIKEGKKPIIGFASTMESFLETLTNDEGNKIQTGDIINSDFSKVLERRLNSVLRYTVKKPNGDKEYEMIDVYEQDEVFIGAYEIIISRIQRSSIGISSSPIDVLIDKLQSAGYTVLEVTGRNKQLKMLGNNRALVKNKLKLSDIDSFRQFNDNEIDCLLINTAGATGASAHAIPTKKVSKEQVKQRVMIILQVELNISTEVQKRGRINRTGQILKPIYDYVVSAIPAEKRLMMMLQKKLKSLDANTTSNQKQSKIIINPSDVDFLNKIGDKIVFEYLLEYEEFNEKIGDPLKIGEIEEETGKANYFEAAQKVSGRVAILSCKEQEAFYDEIINRYISTVEFLIETDQYDLEVQDIDLRAETKSKDVIIVGKGGESVFGRHSLLEKVEVQNLKKPFSKYELDSLLKQSLGEFTSPTSLQISIIEKYKVYLRNALALEKLEVVAHYDNLIENIINEKQAKKSGDIVEYVKERRRNLEDAKSEALATLDKRYENRYEIVKKNLDFFTVGRVVGYPSITYTVDATFYKAVFLGFQINENTKNPYAPSSIKLRLALANSNKYVAVPMSKMDIISHIKSITYSEIYGDTASRTIQNWDEIVAENSAERVTRYVITGNILQAYGNPELSGSLISYTTSTGGIKKGILMPDGFSPNAKRGKEALRITVPIIYALPIIKSMTNGVLTTKDDFSFQRYNLSTFRVSVSVSKMLGGKFYLDPIIQKLTKNGIFEKSGSQMTAFVDEYKIENLVQYLQDKFSCSIDLVQNQYDRIKDSIMVEDYLDEVKKPEPDVFIEKLTQVDREEEARRAKEEAERKLAEEEAERERELEEQRQKEQAIRELEKDQRKLAFQKKLMNVMRLFYHQEIEMARGGGIGKHKEPEWYTEIKNEAYKYGVEACKKGASRAPAQNKGFMELLDKLPNKNVGQKDTQELMKAFENGYYNENEKELRKKFPEMYENR
jgi:hypothetical protein